MITVQCHKQNNLWAGRRSDSYDSYPFRKLKYTCKYFNSKVFPFQGHRLWTRS